MYLFGILQNTNNEKHNTHIIKEPIGNNPATFAPQTFTPAAEFSGPGLIGNYFSHTKIATIHDPAGDNKTTYTFDNIHEGGLYAPTDDPSLKLIGSFTSGNRCSGGICSHAFIVVNLYGHLVQDDENTLS